MKTVQDILDEKGTEVLWIDPLESALEAARMLREHHVGALLVQIDGYVVGIVSERDFISKVILDHGASKQTKVSEIMTRELITVGRTESALTCINLMREHHIRHLPVVEEGKAVGIVSLRDLFLGVIEEVAPIA
ncbi:MAG TPA: CBS domain-containing protein [Pseudomonadales bacterium]|nr:CBS domain-containing protein [Pseudomonadales bacterium]